MFGSMIRKWASIFSGPQESTPPPKGPSWANILTEQSWEQKFDANQLRGKDGKWAKSVGAGGKFAAEMNTRNYSVSQVVADALGNDVDTIADYHWAIESVNKDVDAGRETYKIHSANGSGKGGFSDARKKLHADIVESFFENEEALRPKPGQKPTFMILGGRGGSGKSNLDKDKEGGKEFGVYSKKHYLVVDPDAIKEMLPEYEPSKAYLTHKESAHIADKLMAEARKRQVNVVLDVTMRTLQKSTLDTFKKHGYRAEAHFMHKTPELALRGAVRRWNRTSVVKNPLTHEAKIFNTGRLVPPAIIEGNVNNEANFDKIAKSVDHWTFTTNESPDGFQGRRIASGGVPQGGLSHVFKANPYKDAAGKFTTKEKAAHRTAQMGQLAYAASAEHAHMAFQANAAYGKQFYSVDEAKAQALALAKDNYQKAIAHGADPQELLGQLNSIMGKGILDTDTGELLVDAGGLVTDELVADYKAMGVNAEITDVSVHTMIASQLEAPITPEEAAMIKAANKYKKFSATMLGKMTDKDYPEAYASYQDAVDKYGSGSSQAKKAAKKLAGWEAQALKYSATPEQLAEMKLKAKKDHETSKSVGLNKPKVMSTDELNAMSDSFDAKVKEKLAAKAKGEKDLDVKAFSESYKKLLAAEAEGDTDGVSKLTKDVIKAKQVLLDKHNMNWAELDDISYAADQEALGKTTKPKGVPKPDSPDLTGTVAKPTGPLKFTEASSEGASVAHNQELGIAYYALRDKLGKNHPDVAAAYAEWQKSKDHLTKTYNYTKDTIGSLSSDAKSAASSAAGAEAAAAAAAKNKHLAEVKDAFKELHSGPEQDGDSLVADAIVAAAKKAGLTDDEIHAAKTNGKYEADVDKKAKKASSHSAVKSAAADMYEKLDKFGPKSQEALDALANFEATKSLHKDQLDTGDVVKLKAEAKDHVVAKAKAIAQSKALWGDVATKGANTAEEYDKKPDSFKWRDWDYKFKEFGATQIAKMNQTEKDVVSGYTGSAFKDTNKQVGKAGTAKLLGKTPDPISSNVASKMKAMDNVFAKTKLGADVNLRRNSPHIYFWDQLGLKLDPKTKKLDPSVDLKSLEGRIYKETAFSSTSMDENFSSHFSSEADKTGLMTFRIRASADMPGLRAKEISNHSSEDEVILPRGTTYVIRKVTEGESWQDSKYFVDVDMIGAFPDDIL